MKGQTRGRLPPPIHSSKNRLVLKCRHCARNPTTCVRALVAVGMRVLGSNLPVALIQLSMSALLEIANCDQISGQLVTRLVFGCAVLSRPTLDHRLNAILRFFGCVVQALEGNTSEPCAASPSDNVTARSPYRMTRMANRFRPDTQSSSRLSSQYRIDGGQS
jgi:hypothetical protein